MREDVGEGSTTTYLVTEDVWSTGIEAYTFLPFLRLGRSMQFGVVLAGGLAKNFSGTVQQRIEGRPIYASNPFVGPQVIVPQGPGFVVDDRGNIFEVRPGEIVAMNEVVASNLYRVSGWDVAVQMLGRAELAAAFDVRPALRIRAGGGFNFPGFPTFSIEIVYLLGVPASRR